MHATPAEVRRTLRHNGGPWALPGARTEAAGLDQCLQAMRLALRSVDPPAHGHRGCRAVTLPGHPEESRIDEPRVARQERTAASSLARPGPFDTGLEKR